MSARKILAALILVLYASCSFAEVTPKQVLADPRFSPLVEITRKQGAEYLPGRYVVTMETPSRTGGQKILAPTPMILDIEEPDPLTKTYSFHADIYGERQTDGYMFLDTEAEAPTLFSYTKNEDGKYEMTGRSYVGLSIYGNDHSWLTGAVSDGSINILIPASDVYFPEGWYLGSWKCEDGTQFTFDGDKMSANGQEIGTFTVDESRITVTAPDGSKDTVYAIWNPYRNILVMTFTSGPNGMGTNAGVFERMTEAPKPAAPKPEPTPQTETPKTESESAPKMPTEFPPMPNVSLPPQNLNIDGVWGAYYNGRQFITQYQGNNYYGWIDGQPSEMGVISIKGKTITGTNNQGVDFTAELELDETGKFLDMIFPNGNVIHYQKLQ